MRKRLLRMMALFFLPFIASLLMRFIYVTAKKTFHIEQPLPDGAVIFAFWHGNLLLQPFVYRHLRQHVHANVLISEHFDGRLIAKTMRYFQLDTISGSTSKGASKVLRAAIATIRAQKDIGITPDGPKGPRFFVAPGVEHIARMTGAPVVCFYVSAAKKWQLRSWDKFEIPKPFSRLNIYVSAPIYPHDEEFMQRLTREMMSHVS